MPRTAAQNVAALVHADAHPPAAPPLADTLPSIAELGALRRRLMEARNVADEEATAAEDHTPERTTAELARNFADDRERAVTTLALTLRARTLADAAEQIAMLLDRVDLLTANTASDHFGAELTEVWRGLASVLPVVARGAGTTDEQLSGPEFCGLMHRRMPELGSATR